MIVLALQFRCVACGLALEVPRPIPPGPLPATIERLEIPAPPEGWVRTIDGHMHCPNHPPRRVQPVTAMPGGLRGGH